MTTFYDPETDFVPEINDPTGYPETDLSISIQITSERNYSENIIRGFSREKCYEAFIRRASMEDEWKLHRNGGDADFKLAINIHSHMRENLIGSFFSGFTLATFPVIMEYYNIDVSAKILTSDNYQIAAFFYDKGLFKRWVGWPIVVLSPLIKQKDHYDQLADQIFNLIKQDLRNREIVFQAPSPRTSSEYTGTETDFVDSTDSMTEIKSPSSPEQITVPGADPETDEIKDESSILAVMDFTVEGISEAEGSIITDLLTSAFFNSGRYRVIDRKQREIYLEEIKFSMEGCTDEGCQIEVGRMLSAERIVMGSIGRVGTRLIFNAALVKVESSETIGTANKVFTSLDDLVDNCYDLALSLVETD